MTEAGLSPLEALHATTGSAAELLDVASDRGRIRPACAPTSCSSTATRRTSTELGDRVRAVYLDGIEVSRRRS